MKKTLFLGAILGAALCGNAFAAFNCEQIVTKTDSLSLGATTGWTAGKTDEEVILTIDLTALGNVASGETPSLFTVLGNNCTWGLRAKEGGTVTGQWGTNDYGSAVAYNTIKALDTEESGTIDLIAKVGRGGAHLTSVDGATSLYSNGGLKSSGGTMTSYTLDGTGIVTAANHFTIDGITVDFGGGDTHTYTSFAKNSVATSPVEASIIMGSRLELNAAGATNMSANGGDIIVGTKGQLYLSGNSGTLSNDVYIGGSDIYTEKSAGYTYDGDMRMDSNTTLAGNLILKDDATMTVGGSNTTISGEIQGAGKDLTINVGYSALNQTLTLSGGGEVEDLTIGNANHHLNVDFTDNAFAANSITTGGGITVSGGNLHVTGDVTLTTATSSLNITGGTATIDGAIGGAGMLNLGEGVSLSDFTLASDFSGSVTTVEQADLIRESVTLNAGGVITLGEDHTGTLTTSALTVNGDATINADLVFADNSIITFTEGSVTLGCSVTFGENTTIALGTAYVEDMSANGQVLLFSGVDGLDPENLKNVTVTIGGVQGILLAEVQQDGSYNLYATPEPATTTLSLLALAGLMARRKRH